MRHIRNYAAARRALKEYFALQYSRARHDCEVCDRCFGNPKCLDRESGRELYRIDEETTRCAKGYQIDAGYVERVHEFLEKTLPEMERRWTDRLEAADMAGKLIEISISVNWAKSRTWGANPHAECLIRFADAEHGTRSAYSEGRASGCGFDKRSAAVQEAFELAVKRRDSAGRKESLALAKASLDRFVIEHGEELWKEYAVVRHPVPHFDIGAKGMSTFTRLFQHIGRKYDVNYAVKDYLIDCSEQSRGSDSYHVIRKDMV